MVQWVAFWEYLGQYDARTYPEILGHRRKKKKGKKKKIVRFPLRAAGGGSERRRTPDCRAHKGKTGSRVWHVLRGFLITGRCPDDFFAGRTGRERWKGWAGWKGWMAWLLGSVRPVTLRHCLLHTYILLDQWIRCTMYDAESSMIASMITTTIATTFPSEPSMDLRCPSHLNTRVPVLVGDLQ